MNAPNPTNKAWGRGDWMQTYTGRAFYPMDPHPDDIDAADIAHSLSLLCRYNGHVKRFYSVAEHCVHLSHFVSPENALWALLHDATEAYVGDMIRPLKKHQPAYVEAEERVMEAIAARFGLSSSTMPAEVKDADNRILLDERAALLSEPPQAWAVSGQKIGVHIEGWLPPDAERIYFNRLAELAGGYL